MMACLVVRPLVAKGGNIGALIIRIGFGGIIYYIYNKEPSQ